MKQRTISHLNRLSPENNKVLRAHHHEAREFMAKDALDIILLLDSN